MKFLGMLFIIDGILTMLKGVVAIGALLAISVNEEMKYVVGISEIIVGVYILYLAWNTSETS